MFRNLSLVVTLASCILLVEVALFAAVPQQITYQGKLSESESPVTGDRPITFKLYSAGGSQVWSSGVLAVTCTNGLFSVHLGAAGQPAFPTTLFNDTGLTIGITVGAGSELVPRSRLTSTAFSYQALRADTATIAEGLTDNTVTSAKITNGTIQLVDLAQNGAGTNQIIKWNGSAWAVANDSVGTSGSYLPLVGGTMTGPITSTGDPSITMGKGNFGIGNTNAGDAAFVAGEGNDAAGDHSAIGGGLNNITDGSATTIAGGAENKAWGYGAAIGGGDSNFVAGSPRSTIGGGAGNYIWYGSGATIAGGVYDSCTETGTTIGGGRWNRASGLYATISGGYRNHAGFGAAIAGGYNDTATGWYSFVGGGDNNKAIGLYSATSGGSLLRAEGDYSVVGGGFTNAAVGIFSGVGSGIYNLSGHTLADSASVVAGGMSNRADSSFSAIGGGVWNQARGRYAAVMGGYNNSVENMYSFAGGGYANLITGQYSFIGGGYQNKATGLYATVGGGAHNFARGDYSVIAGGGWAGADSNSAPGKLSCIGGGAGNRSVGDYSIIPGGYNCTSQGNFSFAAGTQAKANHLGSFVWADNSGGQVATTGNNQFVVRAAGGTVFYTNAAKSSGVYLSVGAGAWSTLSDRDVKANIAPVDGQTILERLSTIDINSWNYTSQDESIRHIGPMAQDFYTAFGVGEDSLHITTIDADGVALAAIKELAKENSALKAQNIELKQETSELRRQLVEIRKAIERLSSR
jgi:trimeric autotransporter adhesin